MMKTTLKVFAMLVVLSSVSAVSLSAPDATLEAMAGYRQWTRMKGEPGRLKIVPGDAISVERSEMQL
jgi:hypothetical protein